MRGEENSGAISVEPADNGPDEDAALYIEAGCGLVQEYHCRVVHQGHGDKEPLSHPQGELAGLGVTFLPQTQLLQEFSGPRLASPSRNTMEFPGEYEVGPGGKLHVDVGHLRHHSDVLSGAVSVFYNVMSIDEGCTFTWGKQGNQHAHRGGLARTVRPEEAEDFPFPYPKTDVVNSENLTVVLGQVDRFNRKAVLHLFPIQHPGSNPATLLISLEATPLRRCTPC